MPLLKSWPALTFSRIESRIFPDLVSAMTVPVAMAICSAIASGMIALTGIVFSLTFVMVQFIATAYSPRLVLWITRDPVLSRAGSGSISLAILVTG